MASPPKLSSICVIILILKCASSSPTPTPTPWPHQFHTILFMNYSGILQKIDLWYDWPNGRNFNIIQEQLRELLYDLEWNNGTSFFYTLDSNKKCRTSHVEVGILRPSWLDGAEYLGQQHVDGFLCNVWQKVDFIWYYEDVVSRRPVHWVFYTGREAHVMTFEVEQLLRMQSCMMYASMFHRLEGRSLSPTPPANSLPPIALPDVSQNDSPLSLSITLSYDADRRYSRSQRDGLVSRKSVPHFQQDSHPHLRNLSGSALESLGFGGKWNGVGLDTKVDNKLAYGLTCVQPSSEDEDVCPTCLEGDDGVCESP